MKMIETLKKLGKKHMVEYVEKFGENELISTFEIPAKFKQNGIEKGIEEFYKYCLEQNKKARDIIKTPKDAIL